jgi:hypothetical protein
MTPMEGFVHHWFLHYTLNHFGPLQSQYSREWIEEAARSHPGFADALRMFALQSLDGSEAIPVRRGLNALAIVGRTEDLLRIEDLLGDRDKSISAEARTTIAEIKRRAV